MRNILRMAAMMIALGLVAPAAYAGADDPPPQLVQKSAPPPAKAKGLCAAIAWSTNHKKPDGWGAESFKDTCEAATSSAVTYCEQNLKQKGIHPATCNDVLTSTAWVVGIACFDGDRSWRSLGAGETPAEAIQAALKKIGHVPARRCGTTLIRSADHPWRDFYSTPWKIELSCGHAVTAPSARQGFTALTRALLSCNRAVVGAITVKVAEHE